MPRQATKNDVSVRFFVTKDLSYLLDAAVTAERLAVPGCNVTRSDICRRALHAFLHPPAPEASE
jgi:hypothetical protein